ncbi:glycosyltransferase family 4 protein [Candidatus Woesearchaeota archaeon]|nr:glycosyltransferase family 4 protein [Candidatus Woesearchaeota archaeon]
MSRKKILITTDCYLPRWDGVARFLLQLLPEIKNQFEITVIAPFFEGKYRKIPGIKIKRLPIIPLQFGDIYFSFQTKEISKYVAEADLVFNQTIGPIGAKAINEAYKQGKPIISYIHSIEWELASRAVKRFKWLTEKYVMRRAQNLYNQCSILAVPSQETEDILSAHKIKTKKIVIELGINPEKFAPPLSKATAKKELKIPEKTTVIGFAGRIGREKNLTTLTKAFTKINKRYKDTVLLIVGGGLLNEIQKHIKIIKTGTKDNILPYLQAMDIFVLPSLTETTSLSTLEAMSTGIAVIGTPVGVIRKYIKDQENGMIFPRGDVSSLVDKLTMLLNKPEMIKKLGKAARNTIKQKAHWEETVRKIRIVLEKI